MQSSSTAAATATAAAARRAAQKQQHQKALPGGPECRNGTIKYAHSDVNGVAAHKQPRQHLPQQQQQQHGIAYQLRDWRPAGLCGIVAVVATLLAFGQHSSTLYSLSAATLRSSWTQQWSMLTTSLPVWQVPLVMAAVAPAVLAPVLYCLIMQLLPSCFSIGEGAMMAQGAAGLAAAAALAVPDAAAFIPAAVCRVLPAAPLHAAVSLGGCSSSAHSSALSLQLLPSAILLVLAATLLVCLLLRALLAVLGFCGSSTHRIKAAASTAAAPTGQSAGTCPEQPVRTASMRSRSAALVVWPAAATITAAMAPLLLWLCCAACWTLLEFLPARPGRLLVLVYWVGLLGVSLPALGLWASHSKVPQVRAQGW